MPRNVEIKARIDSIEAIAPKVAALANDGPVEILQDDTFFCCERGRLKLRTFTPAFGELIYYRRADHAQPKESFYVRTPTSDPATLRETLALACGEAGRVRKRRTLYLVDRTRVHLDDVEGLGQFLELEVVLRDGEPVEDGVAIAHDLMAALDVVPDSLVDSAYVDLMQRSTIKR